MFQYLKRADRIELLSVSLGELLYWLFANKQPAFTSTLSRKRVQFQSTE